MLVHQGRIRNNEALEKFEKKSNKNHSITWRNIYFTTSGQTKAMPIPFLHKMKIKTSVDEYIESRLIDHESILKITWKH